MWSDFFWETFTNKYVYLDKHRDYCWSVHFPKKDDRGSLNIVSLDREVVFEYGKNNIVSWERPFIDKRVGGNANPHRYDYRNSHFTLVTNKYTVNVLLSQFLLCVEEVGEKKSDRQTYL